MLFWAYLAIPIQFYWVGTAWYGMFAVFIPVYMFLFLPFRTMLIRGERTASFKAVGTLNWGLMAAVYSISHAAYLLVLPAAEDTLLPSGAGLLLFLVAADRAQRRRAVCLGPRARPPQGRPDRSAPTRPGKGLLGGDRHDRRSLALPARRRC